MRLILETLRYIYLHLWHSITYLCPLSRTILLSCTNPSILSMKCIWQSVWLTLFHKKVSFSMADEIYSSVKLIAYRSIGIHHKRQDDIDERHIKKRTLITVVLVRPYQQDAWLKCEFAIIYKSSWPVVRHLWCLSSQFSRERSILKCYYEVFFHQNNLNVIKTALTWMRHKAYTKDRLKHLHTNNVNCDLKFITQHKTVCNDLS